MTEASRHKSSALAAALNNRCPACGGGPLLTGFLTPAPRCESCGADFTPHSAGDGAVFIVLTLLCFLVMGAALTLEFTIQPPAWVHILFGAVLTGVLMGALLPFVKRFMIAQSLISDAGQVGAKQTAGDGAD